jgi:outer membrane receptor protein involved in Fe transport
MQTTSRPNTGSLSFDFTPDETRFMGQPWSNQTGFGFASFLLGNVHSASQETPGDLTGRRNYGALYAQDDFRVNDKLTVNLGLRWEVTGPWSEKNGHWANYDNTAINPTTGVPGLLVFAKDGSTTFEGPRDWKQFGPRVGFSYRFGAGVPAVRLVLGAPF